MNHLIDTINMTSVSVSTQLQDGLISALNLDNNVITMYLALNIEHMFLM